jgi:hypothetical protein
VRPWLAAAAFFAGAVPLAFAVGYRVFGGGWRDLPEPWRTRALVFAALLVAVVAVARRLRRGSDGEPLRE